MKAHHLSNLGVVDKNNFTVIMQIKEGWYNKDRTILKIPRWNTPFHRKCNLSECSFSWDKERFWLPDATDKVKYDGDYLECCNRIMSGLCKEPLSPMDYGIYAGVDKKGKFIEIYPVLLVWNNYGYFIAPRVKNE
jgi:hypothetical protein